MYILSFLLIQTSFLRQLEAITLSAPVYDKCITTGTGFKIDFTSDTDLATHAPDTGLKATFTKDTHTLSVECAKDASVDTKLTCATNPTFSANPAKGNYTLSVGTAEASPNNTYTAPANTQLCYDITCVGTQTPATGEIDFKDDTKKTFTITVPAYTGDTAPVVYAGTTAVTCAANQDKTTLTCTPTKEQMANGKHDIFIGDCKLYAKTITVKNNSGELVSISKLFVLILGLLLF